jgi:peroxiredoxin
MRSRLPLVLAPVLVLAVSWALDPGSSFSQDPAATATAEETGAKVGETAPDFVLTDLDGTEHHLADYVKEKKAVVLEWFNPDCPFVQKHHLNTRSMAETCANAAEHEVVWLAINSNAPGKQGSGLERNRKAVEEFKIAYPVLLDEDGTVGKRYGAKTTPHMFIIDKDGILVYAGAIDNAPNPKDLGDVNYVNKALGECMAGKGVETAQTKAYGCSVKYAS